MMLRFVRRYLWLLIRNTLLPPIIDPLFESLGLLKNCLGLFPCLLLFVLLREDGIDLVLLLLDLLN